MTAERLSLTPRIVSRILSFVVTLAVGIGLSQLIPLQLWEEQGSKYETPAAKQMKRRCPHQR
jgi:hypothetical protein